MSIRLQPLLALTREFRHEQTLEEMLQTLVDTVAKILDTPRASVRLIDQNGTRLMAVCRAGEPLHQNPMTEFKVGEGLIGWIAQHVAPIVTDDAEQDERFAARPGMKGRFGAFIGVPLVSGDVCMGVLSAVNPKLGAFGDKDLDWVTLAAGICEPYIRIARLKRLTQVDPLTGALNRRGLDLALPDSPGLSLVSHRGPVSVLMADIDHFKNINDSFGHQIGDEILHNVTLLLGGVLREDDSVIRYGGEEFLLVLPGASVDRAARIAERARIAIESSTFEADGEQVHVTISLGVVERREGESRHDLIERADKAMYASKKAGRNRVTKA